uniref:Uncharacterized protein n=1 Tax=Kalanchoe fedtschenkoi TaxID=63787 RepID=A0A7N0UY92_KALFE
MSRPMLLVFLLIVLIITSQFEWKQPLVNDQDTTPTASEKQLRISERQESVKEKIILSQEKIIQDLKNMVRDLQEQLKLCQASKPTSNHTSGSSMDNNVIEIEHTDIMHD